jgi:hypothetical protein
LVSATVSLDPGQAVLVVMRSSLGRRVGLRAGLLASAPHVLPGYRPVQDSSSQNRASRLRYP